MAQVYISEYAAVPVISGIGVPIGQEPPILTQSLPLAAGQSNAFSPRTRFIRFHTDAILSYKFGVQDAVTPTVNSSRMAANTTEFFGVVPGQVVAFVANT
jgi:hypothetical protein